MIVGCDIGLKRIGLSILIDGIILPLDPILRKNRLQASKQLLEILNSKNASKLVVGMPSQEIYEDTCRRIKHFIGLLNFSGEIIYIDENLSSLEAFENLSHMKRNSRKNAQKNGQLDSLAACKILQRYLETLN